MGGITILGKVKNKVKVVKLGTTDKGQIDSLIVDGKRIVGFSVSYVKKVGWFKAIRFDLAGKTG